MPGRYVLALDIGTSAVRCLVADERGRPKALCRQEWSYRPGPEGGQLAKDFDPDQLWQRVGELIRKAIHDAGIKASQVTGVTATSQREGMVLLDSAGKELYAGPNIDLRATTEGILIDNQHAREIHSITGHLPSLLFAPAKLKWFEHNQPELFKRISTVLTISDWLIYKLSGEITSEVSAAAEIGLIDIKDRTWAGKLVELLDLPRGIYPVLVTAGSPVGKITKTAADVTGITKDTSVVQGAPDTHCGLLGMGTTGKAEVGVVTGWSIPVQIVTLEPVLDTGAKIWTGCHIQPDRWILESNTGEAGNAFRWLMETVFAQNGISSETAYGIIDEEALQAPTGAQGVVALVGPQIMDMTHLEMGLGGFLFPLPLSIGGIRRGDLARAVLESVCFAIKANLSQVETLSGLKAEVVRVGGNMTKSRGFKRLLPDVLNRSIEIAKTQEISALGAAILAAVGSRMYPNIDEATQAMMSELTVNEPDPLVAAEYNDYYQQWLSIVEKMKDIKWVVN